MSEVKWSTSFYALFDTAIIISLSSLVTLMQQASLELGVRPVSDSSSTFLSVEGMGLSLSIHSSATSI